MKYVYVLQSKMTPERYYVGCTSDLKRRMIDHNAGLSPHTKKYAPWLLTSYIAFANHAKADQFEAYLKTGSGRAFSKRHL
ncbi:MAG TPA: GIY-YIG nuclease family protein [Xanthobacteraceae bacterium]|nr:GIY-YIG nuclease family protein [Xanthobacteraceae bacterium]